MSRATLLAVLLLFTVGQAATVTIESAEAFALPSATALFINASLEGFLAFTPSLTRLSCGGSQVRTVFFLTPPVAGIPSRLKAAAVIPGTPPGQLACHLIVGSPGLQGSADIDATVSAPGGGLSLTSTLVFDNTTGSAKLGPGTSATEVYAGLYKEGETAPFKGLFDYTYHCGKLGVAAIPCKDEVAWSAVSREDAKGLEAVVLARSGTAVGYVRPRMLYRGIIVSLNAELMSRSLIADTERMVEEVTYEDRVYGRRQLNLTILPYMDDTLTLVTELPSGTRTDNVAVHTGRPLIIGTVIETDQPGDVRYSIESTTYRYVWNATLTYTAGRSFEVDAPDPVTIYPGERTGLRFKVKNLRSVPGLRVCAEADGFNATVSGDTCHEWDLAPGNELEVEVVVGYDRGPGGNVTVSFQPPESPEGAVSIALDVNPGDFRDYQGRIGCEWLLGRVRCLFEIAPSGTLEDRFYYTIAPAAMSSEPMFTSKTLSGPADKEVLLYDIAADDRELAQDLDLLHFYISLAKAEALFAETPEFTDVLALADRVRGDIDRYNIDPAVKEPVYRALARAVSRESPLTDVLEPLITFRKEMLNASVTVLAKRLEVPVKVVMCNRPYKRAGAAIVRCIANETILDARASVDFTVTAPASVFTRQGREVEIPVKVTSSLSNPAPFVVRLSSASREALEKEGTVDGSRTFIFKMTEGELGDVQFHASAFPSGQDEVGRTTTVLLHVSDERYIALETIDEVGCTIYSGVCKVQVPVTNRGTDEQQVNMDIAPEGGAELAAVPPEVLEVGETINLTASISGFNATGDQTCVLLVVPVGNESLAYRVTVRARPVRSEVEVLMPDEVGDGSYLTIRNKGEGREVIEILVPDEAYSCVYLSKDGEFTMEPNRDERVKLAPGESCPSDIINLTVMVSGQARSYTVKVPGVAIRPPEDDDDDDEGSNDTEEEGGTWVPLPPPTPEDEGSSIMSYLLIFLVLVGGGIGYLKLHQVKATSTTDLAPIPGGKAEMATTTRAAGPKSYYTKAYRTYYTYRPPPL